MSPLRLLLPLLAAAGCGTTGQRELTLPALFRGDGGGPITAGDYTVLLDRAEVGFGPAYFCATSAAAADLCPVAVAELAASATVDGKSAAWQPLGEIQGTTGEVRSATYDFAYTWFPTQRTARPTSAAPGGHSLRLGGRASRGNLSFRFVAEIDVVPRLQGTRSVEGARLDPSPIEAGGRLEVNLPVRSWVAGVDFDELRRQGGDPVVVAQDSRAGSALIVAMTAAAPPQLAWVR